MAAAASAVGAGSSGSIIAGATGNSSSAKTDTASTSNGLNPWASISRSVSV